MNPCMHTPSPSPSSSVLPQSHSTGPSQGWSGAAFAGGRHGVLGPSLFLRGRYGRRVSVQRSRRYGRTSALIVPSGQRWRISASSSVRAFYLTNVVPAAGLDRTSRMAGRCVRGRNLLSRPLQTAPDATRVGKGHSGFVCGGLGQSKTAQLCATAHHPGGRIAQPVSLPNRSVDLLTNAQGGTRCAPISNRGCTSSGKNGNGP
jgi:hypothetical protein